MGESPIEHKSLGQKLNNPLTYLILAWVILGIILTVAGKALHWHNPWSVGWTVPNFLILVSLLWYFGKVPMKDFLAGRREEIVTGLDKAENMKKDAESRRKDIQARLDNIEAEIGKLKQSAAEEAQVEKENILAEARRQAERIKNDAQFTASQELKKAQASLRAETASLAVQLAEKLLKETIDNSDRKRLLDEYIDRVEAEK